MYLLDVNIISYALTGKPTAVRRRMSRIPLDELAVSAITEAELRYGLAKQPRARVAPAVEEFLRRTLILAWDSAAAAAYGDLRAQLEERGEPLGAMDLLVAAHALSANRILVTHDQGFSRIKNLEVEDWTR
jgi:tRNA(fMet)-specific endonuclease VapC